MTTAMKLMAIVIIIHTIINVNITSVIHSDVAVSTFRNRINT